MPFLVEKCVNSVDFYRYGLRYHTRKWIMKRRIYWILAVVRIILLVVYIFAFTYGSFGIFLLFILFFLGDIIKIKELKNKNTRMKRGVSLVADGLIIGLLWFTLTPGAYPVLYYKSEELRYRILHTHYQQAAEQILPHLDETEWMNRRSYQVDLPFLTDESFLSYRKNGDAILLLFGTGNADRESGIAYFSNEEAYKMMEYYRYYNKVDENWAVYTTE